MAGFADIIPETEVLHGVTMRGIPSKELFALCRRFPALLALLQGNLSSDLDGEMVTAIVMAGCDHDEDGKAAFEKLPFHTQCEFVPPVARLTVGKNGIGPIIQNIVVALGGDTEIGPEPKKMRLQRFVRPSNGSSTSEAEASAKSSP